jgi:hypothetical protein
MDHHHDGWVGDAIIRLINPPSPQVNTHQNIHRCITDLYRNASLRSLGEIRAKERVEVCSYLHRRFGRSIIVIAWHLCERGGRCRTSDDATYNQDGGKQLASSFFPGFDGLVSYPLGVLFSHTLTLPKKAE